MQPRRAPLFDFTTAAGVAGWMPAHDIARLEPTSRGLVVTISGSDPYLVGPQVAVPTGQPLWLVLTLQATQSGMGQVFYYAPGAGPSEKASVRFAVKAGGFVTVRVALPALPGPTSAFRIDPPGLSGAQVVIAALDVEPRVVLPEPTWTKPQFAEEFDGRTTRSGLLGVTEGKGPTAPLVVTVDGNIALQALEGGQLAYQTAPNAPLQWLTLRGTTTTDPDGAVWTVTRTLTPKKRPGSIGVLVTLTVSKPRYLAHFPALLLFAEKRQQAILCGVEYLDAPDRSSSEDDLEGEQAKRQSPEPHTLTIPLMAVQAEGRWVALAWGKNEHIAPYFDSPNRTFGNGMHVMGLLFPGGVRSGGHVLPEASATLTPGRPLTLTATLYGGIGESVVPAIQAWVREHPLPSVPTFPDPIPLATAGYLDSADRVGGRYKHALPGEFPAQAAVDAGVLEAYLAAQSKDSARAAALQAASTEALALGSPGEVGGIGHIRTFAPTLFRGDVALAMTAERERAKSLLRRFQPDGTILYSPGKTDYGRTHFEKTANGLTAQVLANVLESAAFCGDKTLAADGVRRLKQLWARWKYRVPRGAQTWEVPLHTPDILAAAHLVKAYTLGYELSGERQFLDIARYWAWTGVPFVYLVPPTNEPVGLYASIAVLGATGWVAPNWIGLPVQWCGLVYADALHDLAAHDQKGPWKRLADGIAASGAQQSFPPGSDRERQGLLPDSFSLVAQLRNDPAINPSTLLVPMARTLGKPVYTRTMLSPGVCVHAPGRVTVTGKTSFIVEGWPRGEYTVVVSGLPRVPASLRPVESGPGWFALRGEGRWRVAW